MCPPPQSGRTQCDIFYPKTAPVFLRPGPGMQECETRMSACTLAAPCRVWDKAWPVRVGGTRAKPTCLERLAVALGAKSLDKGAGRWAGGVLSPERRQAGMTAHCFDRKPGYMAGGQSGSRVTPLNAECCMPGKACTTGEKVAAGVTHRDE